jgi:hypothetical protein
VDQYLILVGQLKRIVGKPLYMSCKLHGTAA